LDEEPLKTAMQPHVVIIMADELRFDVLGKGYTPRIDALAAEGVSCERAYCASPLCVPARGSFFSGRYPNETGCIINPWEKREQQHGALRTGNPNLYQLLDGAWDSWHAGKQHFLTEDRFDQAGDSKTHWQTDKGYGAFLKQNGKRAPGGAAFKTIVPEMAFGTVTRKREYSIPTTGCYPDGLDYFFDGFILNQALTALRDRDRAKPVLLNAMFLAPHPPLEVPEPWFSMYKTAALPENVGVWSPRQSPLQLYNLPGFVGSRYTRADWQRIWPVYLGLVTLLDHCVGRVVDELKAQGIYDDTLLLFTSDHGDMLGSHCLWQKMCMYEESVRTPLILKFPVGFQPARRKIPDVVSAVDVLPTLCDFLKIAPPPKLSGVSLLPAIHGEALKRDRIFIQFDGNGARGNFQRCVIEGDFKLIVDMFQNEIFLELYNTAADPQEMNNLAFEPAQRERVEAMLSCVRDYMQRTGDMIALPENVFEKFIRSYA
jgi:arylsulfatase A-like enzyme